MRTFVSFDQESYSQTPTLKHRYTRSLREKHQQEKDLLVTEHMDETLELQKEFASLKANLEAKVLEHESNLAVIKQKWNTRPPRREDVIRIRDLEILTSELRKQLSVMVDKMRFYKLELVNREKNFNKMFGQKEMNVGVIKVGGAKKKKRNKRSGERRGGSAPKPPKNGGGRFPDVGRS